MTMIGYTTGLSALTASQEAINIEGQNIANANTPGYHRQTVDLRAAQPTVEDNLSIGTGVDVADINRARSELLDNAVNINTSATAATTAQLGVLQQLQNVIAPSSGSVSDLLGQFFNQLNQLSATPDDMTARQTMLSSAGNLTAGLQSLSASFTQIGQSLDAQLSQTVQQINGLTSQISQLNGSIQSSEAAGGSPNDQLDQRDQLINQLGGLVNIQTVEAGSGVTNVLAAGQILVQGTQTTMLTYAVDNTGNGSITAAGLPPLAPTGGTVAGLLQVRNQVLPDYQGSVNALAHQLIQSANAVQSTGLGLPGPVSILTGTQAVTSTTQPLAQAGLNFPPQAGSLYVTVTNLATGAKTVNQVTINPNSQSLQDVAGALSAVPHLQGVVNAQSGTLSIVAHPGYAFSFAPQLSTAPDAQAITGTTTVQVGGAYTGGTNGALNFKVVGSGTVGVTPNLTLAVQDSAGNTVASLNIGQGYEPGSALKVAHGVTVQLASGAANAGDTFSVTTVAQPDTGGILPALGLNTFFSGSNAADVAVNPHLLADPGEFAGSLTGQPGDGANVANMAALGNAPLLANGAQTLQQSFENLIGKVGSGVQDATQQQSAQQAVGQSLQTQMQSVSGVDPNEELVQLVQSQQSYQLAAHYISVLDQTVNSLLQIT